MQFGVPTETRTRSVARAAGAAWVGAVVGAATLGGAWFFQYALGYMPCELCMTERIPYYISIPLGVVVALVARRQVSPWLLTLGLAILALLMLADGVLSAYHAGVEWHFWPGPDACTAPLGSLGGGGGLLGQLQDIHVPRCDEAAWRFLGISLAGYNALITFALAFVALWGIGAARPSRPA